MNAAGGSGRCGVDAEFWRRRMIDSLIDRARAVLRALRSWGLVFLCLAIVAVGGGATDDTDPLRALAALELPDLEGTMDSLDAHRGHTVVVMVVSAKRLRTLKAWERDLRERFEDLHYLRIADVPREPPTTYERVVARLGDRVPEEVRVLVDMDGAWSAALGLDTSRPNLLLVRPDGTVASTYQGRHDPDLAAAVAQDLAELMESS
jgi:hypothetical protein